MHTLKSMALLSSETSITYRPVKWRHVPAELIPQPPHRGEYQDSAIFAVYDAKIG